MAIKWWHKLKRVLSRTASQLSQATCANDLEEQLLMADFGVHAAQYLSQYAGDMESLRSAILKILQPTQVPFVLHKGGKSPMVVLMMGVNGSGKTTSIAKLAHLWRDHKVGLVAGDTFRHGAVEQLKVWGQALGIPCYHGITGADPASVVFEALQSAQKDTLDMVLVDTSGRLHTQSNLMDELAKIKRVIQKWDASAPHETLLVLDGTTGQNALTQVEQFHRHVGLTGLMMTKLDGSARGGMVVHIAEKMKQPIYYIGTGETLHDLQAFHAQHFVEALLG